MNANVKRYIPIVATLSLIVALYFIGVANYSGFSNPQLLVNLFISNAGLLIVAVGMTFVILTGGIDLSVGSLMAFSTMAVGWMTIEAGIPAQIAVPAVIVLGGLNGALTGAVIHYFNVQPFIATLAGLFLYRGLTFQISTHDISLRDVEFFQWGMERVDLGSVSIPNITFLAFGFVLIAFCFGHYTRLGRTVYAVGGNENSAALMGLPVARSKISVYAFSGICASTGGVVTAFYIKSANPLQGVGFELDAIAAVVIGGTLLTGGYGFVLGTMAGVSVLGLIDTIIAFQGNLSSWWARIAIGALLLAFILLQRFLSKLGTGSSTSVLTTRGGDEEEPDSEEPRSMDSAGVR
nr:ABC transporter permease [Haloglycomyces albus]